MAFNLNSDGKQAEFTAHDNVGGIVLQQSIVHLPDMGLQNH